MKVIVIRSGYHGNNSIDEILTDNFSLAKKKRLTAIYRRLQKTPENLNQYDEIIKLQEKEVIIEAVDPNQIPEIGGRHYIPHREVVKGDLQK